MGIKTGRLHPHHHTSYPALAFLLVLTALLLAAVNWNISAATLTTTGSVSLSGEMAGPPPTAPPSIQSPTMGQRFTRTPVNVSGTCIGGLRVVILRSNVVAGQTYCTSGGSFQLMVDLVPGANDLTARQYDALDQASPSSPAVTVFYDKPSGPNVLVPGHPNAPKLINPVVESQPFIISSAFSGRHIFPETEFKIPIDVAGGVAPYAVHIDWGDGGSSLLSMAKAGSLNAPYTYASPGIYSVIIKATDANGAAAYFQSALTVNGKTVAPPATTLPDRQMIILWPIFIIIGALVLGFWLGDRFENGRWRHRQEKAPGLS